jgi:LytR cell envelope-related transcriptional attenuator
LTGKHEPPSGSSFYVSLATATLRAGLIVAAVAIGVFVLSRAFPEADSPTPQSTGGPIVPSPATSPTEAEESPSPSPEASPEVEGVRLAVLNGTSETGLAAAAAQDLRALGYRVDDEDIGDAQNKPYEVTTLFFRPNSRLEAQHLRNTVFKGAKLERATAQLDPDVRITVVLGLDWAD